MRVPKWLALVLALALFAAACGGDDDGSSEDGSGSSPSTTAADSSDADSSDSDSASSGDEVTDDADAGADADDDAGEDAAPAGPSGELRYGTPLAAATFDPHLENRDFGMLFYSPIYDGLVNELPDNSLVPGLATEWEISPTEARFTLREGVTFHDGTPFNADAVKWNIEKAKATPGATGALLLGIESVDVVSPTEVVFNMTGPDRDLLLNLARFPGLMMSPNVDPEAIAAGSVSAGTGPYQLVSRNESEIVMEVNPNSWSPEDQGVERITFIQITDDEARFNALVTGEVDIAPVRVFQIQDTLAAGYEVAHLANNHSILHFHDIGGNLVPEFADVRVRQAIAHLINREGWGASVTRGIGQPANQVFPEGSPWHIEGYEGFPYDPERAAELLAAAGVTDLTFEVPSWGIFNVMHQAASAMLAEGGITMNIRDVPPGANISDVAAQQVGASLTFISTIHADQTFGIFLSPPTLWNPWHVPVPSVIGPYQQAVGAATDSDADAAYRAMLQEAYDLAWIVPIYRNENSMGYDDDKFDIELWENVTIGMGIRGLRVNS